MKQIDSLSVSTTRLKSIYYEDMDRLEIGVKNNSIDSEPNEISCFRNMNLITDEFGEPVGLNISGVKENNWHMNRDLLKLALIMHFDVSEGEAHKLVDMLYSKAKF